MFHVSLASAKVLQFSEICKYFYEKKYVCFGMFRKIGKKIIKNAFFSCTNKKKVVPLCPICKLRMTN